MAGDSARDAAPGVSQVGAPLTLALAAQLFFNELTTERARELFSDFVGLWNGRRLPAKYYRGIEGTTMRRTQHSWAVRGASMPKRSHTCASTQTED